jgi:hypothetical protein
MSNNMLEQIADGRTDLVFDYVAAGNAATATDKRLGQTGRGGRGDRSCGRHRIGVRRVTLLGEMSRAPQSHVCR